MEDVALRTSFSDTVAFLHHSQHTFFFNGRITRAQACEAVMEPAHRFRSHREKDRDNYKHSDTQDEVTALIGGQD